MVSRARNLSGLMGTSSTLDINDIANLGDLTGVDSYADSDALALAVVPIGTQAYQADTGSFKIYRGASGWAQMDEFPVGPTISQMQGSSYGYSAGGGNQSGIDLYPFASETTTSVGPTALTYTSGEAAANSSRENGYSSGPVYGTQNVIQKFSFPLANSSNDVGDLTVARNRGTGSSSTVSGYTSGGVAVPAISNIIDKFSFAADGNATDVGDLTTTAYYATGQASTTHGYRAGGYSANVIDKFPFASDGNATDVGDLTGNTGYSTGNSSLENGYVSGQAGSVGTTGIQKFPFAADANASNIGDLTFGNYVASSQNSATDGYVTFSTTNKFSFASDGDATNIASSFSTGSAIGTGHQV